MPKILITTDDISMITTTHCRGLVYVKINGADAYNSDDIRKKINKIATKEAHELHANTVMNFHIHNYPKYHLLTADGTAAWLSSSSLDSYFK